MESSLAADGIPWVDVAIAGTQALIALALVWLTWKIHSTQMRIQRALKVQEWGNNCISLLAEADHFCLLIPKSAHDLDYEKDKNNLLRRLSASIDQGRMFFENKHRQRHGQCKPSAYQGLRPRILDPLVAAYLAIEALDSSSRSPDHERKARLVDWRRFFVSILQKELNPEWLKKATRYDDASGGGAGDNIDRHSAAPAAN